MLYEVITIHEIRQALGIHPGGSGGKGFPTEGPIQVDQFPDSICREKVAGKGIVVIHVVEHCFVLREAPADYHVV